MKSKILLKNSGFIFQIPFTIQKYPSFYQIYFQWNAVKENLKLKMQTSY